MADNVKKFRDATAKSLRDDTFVKLTLSNYKGADESLQKILVRRITTKKGDRLDLTYRHRTRDVAKNHPLDEAQGILSKVIGRDFRNANLFTTADDYQLEVRKNGESKLSRSKPTHETKASQGHDRAKKLSVDPHARYLRELGIASEKGEILGKQRDKWTQINKYIEILAGLIDNSSLSERKNISIVDMGSGKGYLTFALYDFLTNTRGIEAVVIGVETRKELVDLCNDVASRCGFKNLSFVQNTIEGFEMPDTDILIALHACDTATDDALYKGVTSAAEIIVAAPCCHKEIRRQIKSPADLAGVLKHGTLLESTAETITDGLRAMLLEREGYSTKVFEFVGAEHTPKNNMITATRQNETGRRAKAASDVGQLKRLFSIGHQRLDHLLERRAGGK